MRLDTWRAMEDMCHMGKAKSIGVSNFTVRHFEELRKIERITPMVNQVEFHPMLVQSELMEYCKSRGIVVQAYGSLGEGNKKLLGAKEVVGVGLDYKKSPAQVLLRWGIQHGCVIIPRSSKKRHIRENADLFNFQLTPQEMIILDSLNCNKRFCWKGVNPETIQ